MARAFRQPGGLRARSLGTVAVGQWVVVPVTGEAFPASIRIGHVQQPAFIDFEGRGTDKSTVVKVRCPQLAPGDYEVLATTPSSAVQAMVTVV